MQVVNVLQAGKDHQFKWPSGDVQIYPTWIEYRAVAKDGEHKIRIGFGLRQVYSQERIRVVVWIDGHPHTEFLGADDFQVSGEVLSEIKVGGDVGENLCRYPKDSIPERYAMFNTVGLPVRINAKGVRKAWAVVANISDHRAMVALAALRRYERG